jgi:hypothetical protein
MRPGTGVSAPHTAAASASGTPSARRPPQHQQQVAGVEIAHQRAAHVGAMDALHQGEGQAFGVVAQAQGPQACRACQRDGPQVRWWCRSGPRGEFVRQRGAPLVVDVDHRRAQARPVEERTLGGPVGSHAAVVVEMVAREVGEQRDVDVRLVQAAFGDADGRRFQRAGRKALIDEAPEGSVQRDGVRGGQPGGAHAVRIGA